MGEIEESRFCLKCLKHTPHYVSNTGTYGICAICGKKKVINYNRGQWHFCDKCKDLTIHTITDKGIFCYLCENKLTNSLEWCGNCAEFTRHNFHGQVVFCEICGQKKTELKEIIEKCKVR